MSDKKVKIAYLATVFVILFQTVDIFFIHIDGSLFGGNVVARIAGIVLMLVISVAMNANIKNFCFSQRGALRETLIGTAYALASVGFCYLFEFVYFISKGINNLSINVSFPNTNDDMSIRGRLLAIGLFGFTVLLQSVFKEMFFRGYLITQLFDKYGIRDSIIIQAGLYTVLLIPTVAYSVISGQLHGLGVPTAIFVIACNFLIDFVSGFKWGLYYRVNGTIWMSVADHFVNNMLITCVYITEDQLPLKYYVLRALMAQLISLALFIPLYFSRDRMNEEIALEIAVQRELSGLPVDNYSPSPLRHYVDARRKQKFEDFAKKRNIPLPQEPHIIFPSDFEEPVSLMDSGIFPDSVMPPVKAVKVVDKGDVVELKAVPLSDTQKEPTGTAEPEIDDVTTTATASEDKKEISQEPDSSGNISKLVQGYFEENFNRHTF